MEKEQTTFDVQIGDGMDIGIMGENGEHALSFMEVLVVVISFSFQMFTYLWKLYLGVKWTETCDTLYKIAEIANTQTAF